MKQLLVLSACALIVACGASTTERGIASTTTDSTASGSAYNSYDGFAATAQSKTPATLASVAPVAAPTTDSVIIPAATKETPSVTAVKTAPVTAAAKPVQADDSAEIKKGETLISKSDCLACHKVQDKLLGPSYKDVANKYPNNNATIAQLSDKIKKGGSGVWGAIPMSPHPALSDADLKSMVKYILSLK